MARAPEPTGEGGAVWFRVLLSGAWPCPAMGSKANARTRHVSATFLENMSTPLLQSLPVRRMAFPPG
jgi:hypothetical protein